MVGKNTRIRHGSGKRGKKRRAAKRKRWGKLRVHPDKLMEGYNANNQQEENQQDDVWMPKPGHLPISFMNAQDWRQWRQHSLWGNDRKHNKIKGGNTSKSKSRRRKRGGTKKKASTAKKGNHAPLKPGRPSSPQLTPPPMLLPPPMMSPALYKVKHGTRKKRQYMTQTKKGGRRRRKKRRKR